MKILLPDGFRVNIRDFLRKMGYTFETDSMSGKSSFCKRLTTDHYPRYHLYVVKDIIGKNCFTLHFDQKKPSYKNSAAHMAEYDTPIVVEEAKKIQKAIFEQTSIAPQNSREQKNGIFGWKRK